MPELQVKKVVAVCFLEAAKLTLEQLGAHRLELSQQSVAGPDTLPRLYGDVRRLRDYLQRCASGYQDIVALDLSEGDASLLVASCRRAVEAIDVRLVERAMAPDERQWLTKKRQVLGDWAVELAEKPVVDLPLPRLAPVMGEAVRALNTRIQNKVFGDVAARQKIVAPGTGALGGDPAAGGGASHAPSMAQGITSFGDHMAGVGSQDDWQSGSPAATEPLPGPEPEAPELLDEVAAGSESGPALLDRNKIRDPRLRSLVGMDLTAYERSAAAGDYRIATVMLASVMETALLDHAIPRRSELGVSGQPDSWKMHDVLLLAMGDAVEPKDRSLAFHLFAARSLLRPALQMVTPAVVTAASFERLQEFVGRALHALGFGGAAKTLPPGAVNVDELPPV
jgi:hypothetical protein